MSSASTPKRIMRIRLLSGIDVEASFEQVWVELARKTKTFHLSRFLDAEVILITNSDDRIIFTVTPTGIDLVDGHRKMRGSVNEESEWIGQQDPLANGARHNMAYNFER